MKLLQWNIWYKEDIQNVLRVLEELDPDLVCLQELTVNHPHYNRNTNTPQVIAERLGFDYFFKASSESASNEQKQEYGNAIFSRYPIIKADSTFIQNPPISRARDVDYSREGRVYIEAYVHVRNREISVGTTHMSYTDRFLSTPAKEKETDNLLEILRTKKKDYVFSGDLNALPDSYTINEISNVLRHCGPAMEEKTWTTKPFSYHDFEARTLDWRLDYCFATPDIDIRSARKIETNVSDHLPILIEF